MRIFVTGASGHIAAAVIPELLSHGHDVVGLGRTDAAAETIQRLGAEVCRGSLDDLDVLRSAANESDGVIHLAFKHDEMRMGNFIDAVDSDFAATRAIVEGLLGTGKPFVTTGGTLMLAMAGIVGRPGSEDDQLEGGPRVDAGNYALGLAQNGIRSSVIRLAPLVHSDLDHHGFTTALIGFAKEHGVAAYIGDGTNRWPAANTYDIAVLYRLALEKAPGGSTFHGVGDLGIPFKVIAETIAGKLGVPTKSVTPEQAPEYLGYLSGFAGLDNPVGNDKTVTTLGWDPVGASWVDDVKYGHYLR